jgi:hypothetical protein
VTIDASIRRSRTLMMPTTVCGYAKRPAQARDRAIDGIHLASASGIMSDDPDKYRARLKAKLFEAADTMPRAEMAPAREDMVRAFVRETINVVLTNSRPN